MDGFTRFNINNKVKVKLTDEGLATHYKYHMKNFGKNLEKFPYKQPEVDDDGYTTYQLWNLMEIYGSDISLGSKAKFKNNDIFFEVGGKHG